MDGIYTNGFDSASMNRVREHGQSQNETVPEFCVGDVMEGIVTSVSKKVSINFSGKEFSFPKEAVQNAREGEKRTYQIMEVSGASFVLKEIGNAVAEGGQGGVLFTTVDPGLQVMSENFGVGIGDEGIEDNRLNKIANRMTEEDRRALEKEGMTLEKYGLERLERLLERMKAQAKLKQAGVDGQVEEKQAIREAVSKTAHKNKLSDLKKEGLTDAIAERLTAANLPLTESNISKIADAMILSEEAQYMTEASFSYLIGNELSPTIENCYKAVHAGAGRRKVVSSELMEQLQPQVLEQVQKAIKSGEEFVSEEQVLTDAQWLLEHELPLTAKNIAYKQELSKIPIKFGTESLSRAAILEGAVETLDQTGEPQQTNLLVVIKREEVRLKMTEEATDTMRKLNVEVDTEAIKAHIQQLKEQEKEFFYPLLNNAQEEEERSIRLFEQTLTAVGKVESADVRILAESFQHRKLQTLQSLSELAGELREPDGTTERIADGIKPAAAWYEASMTSPRRDLGDSIQKAFQGIDHQLSDMKLELTEANRRAVRILGYNQLPITRENVNEMKYYDAQVSGLVKNLKPQVTVELIRRGINPLEETVAKLSQTAEDVAAELGVTSEERFSEYLVKLDRKHELTPVERESYIGIYRMLYQIEKTDGAVVGAVLKNGREMTLSNLLTESRTQKRSTVDLQAEDTVYERKSFTQGKTINEQIETAYHSQLLREAVQSLSPDRLQQVMKQTDPMQMTVEQFTEAVRALEEGETDREYRNEQMAQLKEAAEGSSLAQQFLNRLGIENSVEQIQAAKIFLEGKSYQKRLQSLANDVLSNSETAGKEDSLLQSQEDAIEAMGSKESLTMLCEKVERTASELRSKLYLEANLSAEQARELSALSVSERFDNKLVHSECFELPIQDENGVSGIRFTVIQGERQQGRFRIVIKGNDQLGMGTDGGNTFEESPLIRVDGVYRNGRLEVLIATNHRLLSDTLRSEDSEIKTRLEAEGIECQRLFYETSRIDGAALLPPRIKSDGTIPKEKVDTKLLYTAAKEIVLHIRNKLRGANSEQISEMEDYYEN